MAEALAATEHGEAGREDFGQEDFGRDCRPVLLALLVLVIALALLARIPAALVGLAGALLLAWRCGLRWRAALRRLLHVEGFLLVLLIMLPLTTASAEPLRLGPLSLSPEGLGLAALIALRVNAALLLSMALLRDLPPEALGRALTGLGLPERLGQMISLLHRQTGAAREGLRRQSEAIRARGGFASGGLRRWHCHGLLIGGALLRALDRAERFGEALRMRGWPGPAPARMPFPRGRALLPLPAALAFAALLLTLDRAL